MKVDFTKGLVPAIVQDENNNEVLMLGYLNEEALNLSLKSGYMHYFSRSKNRIWKKGESSGCVQKIKKIFLDCDNDSLVFKVEQVGSACHTGAKSCFYKEVFLQEQENNIEENNLKKNNPINLNYGILDNLYHVLLERKLEHKQNSYSSSLFKKGKNTMSKKLIEEASEFCFAFKDGDKEQIIYEGADLIFHLLVILANENIHFNALEQELEKRQGISGLEEKASRQE